MKIALGLLLIMVSLTFSQAQQVRATQPSDVTILSPNWEKHVRRTRLDPSDTTGESREEMIARIKGETINDASRNAPGARKPEPVISKPVKTLSKTTEEGYRYRASVKNSGVKMIKAVNWMYIFTDPGSGEELARHRFHTRTKIRPGQVKELAEFDHSPPSKVVSAAGLEKSVAQPFVEQVVITRIEYGDGTVWQIKKVD
jgi:hypothetical protein